MLSFFFCRSRIKSSCYLFFFLSIENINFDGSCAYFSYSFSTFLENFFILFSTFFKTKLKKTMYVLANFCDVLRLRQRKNSQERTFFLRFCFEKRRKKNKKIFQKRRKRIRKMSTRTIKIYVLDRQTKNKREQEMLFLSFSLFLATFVFLGEKELRVLAIFFFLLIENSVFFFVLKNFLKPEAKFWKNIFFLQKQQKKKKKVFFWNFPKILSPPKFQNLKTGRFLPVNRKKKNTDREHKFWWFLCLFFLFFFDFLENFFVLFRLFQNKIEEKNVRSCEFLRCVAPAAEQKIRKNVHFFLRFCFEKRRKRIKNIFQKRRKRIRKISTRTIKIYVLDQQTKKKREQEMLFLSFSMFSSKFLIF